MLEIKNLTKRFKSTYACRSVEFKVKKGEFFVLLGPSGCGKTTILRSIAGLEKPDTGKIVLNGRNITGLSPQERDTAMVFQNYALYPNMTVRKNLEFPLKMHKTRKDKIDSIIKETASLLQIAHLLDKKAVKLSGGQQQRVAVGRALVRKPEIFLLDEPLSNLDAKLRQHLRIELARMHKELKITMIYVTHDQNEAMTLGDRIAVIKDGQIRQIGAPAEVYSRPVDLFTAKFIGFPEINVFEASIKENILEILGGRLFLDRPFGFKEKKVLAAIRPEDISVVREHREIKAHLEIKEVSGPDTVLYMKVGEKPLRVRASKEESEIISADDSQYSVDFDPLKMLFFDPESKKTINK